MEYRWTINLTGTLPDGHTPDLTITHLNTRVSEFIGDNVSNPLVIAGQSLYSFFGQVNGTGGLYPQRDNFHVNEDIHIGAPTVIPAGVAMAETIWPVLRGRI